MQPDLAGMIHVSGVATDRLIEAARAFSDMTGVEFVAFDVTKAMGGRPLQELVLPGESVVGAVVRRGQAAILPLDARLELEDQVYATITVSAIPRLEKMLSR